MVQWLCILIDTSMNMEINIETSHCISMCFWYQRLSAILISVQIQILLVLAESVSHKNKCNVHLLHTCIYMYLYVIVVCFIYRCKVSDLHWWHSDHRDRCGGDSVLRHQGRALPREWMWSCMFPQRRKRLAGKKCPLCCFQFAFFVAKKMLIPMGMAVLYELKPFLCKRKIYLYMYK